MPRIDADRLSRLLFDKGMSQKELAKSLKIYPNNISRWLNGKSFPSESKISEMAKIFNVTERYIKGLPELPEPKDWWNCDTHKFTKKHLKDSTGCRF